MFIKRLEIFGFKSFKNKTVLEFSDREISGVVGPNGCGKSNLVDALLWVMGESSPKSLRGESLADVIFGGTKKESPGNMAEVHLTLGKGKMGFPENYKNFSEIMITRRSYRDGTNEYLINNQSCLLREIREIFMNTGAGCRGFSIIEQEAIEKLITAKPLQRRFIIEEVAGITKFKSRRQESVRKLDLVNRNLQRLDDILKVQESQLSQLTHQAKTAEKYKKLKQEVDKRAEEIEKQEKADIFYSHQNLEKVQEGIKTKEQEKMQQAQLAEKEIEKERKGFDQIVKKELEKKMEEVDLVNKIKAFDMIENIKSSKKDLREKEKAIRQDLEKIQAFFQKESVNIDFTKECQKITSQLNSIRQDEREVKTNINSLAQQIQLIERERNLISEDKDNIQLEIQKNINDKNKQEALLEKYTKRDISLKGDIEAIAKKQKEFEERKEKVSAEVNQLQQSISVLRFKIEELKKINSQFESVNKGVEELLQWCPERFHTLVQKLEIDSDYLPALSSVLGNYSQVLISKDDSFIEQAVERLKSKNLGKAGFLSSLPGVKSSLALKSELSTYPSFVCFLDEKIKWNIHVEPLRFLLEGTVVVSDLSSAFDLKKQFSSFQFVTKEGDFITRDSIIYAGSSDKETNLFRIQQEINKNQEELSSKEIEIKARQTDWDSCMEGLNLVQNKRKSLEEQNSQNITSLVSVKKDIELIEKDLLRFSESRGKLVERIKDFELDKKNLLQHQSAYNKEIQEISKNISLQENQLEVVQAKMAEYQEQNIRKLERERELSSNDIAQKNLEQEIIRLLKFVNTNESDKELEDFLKNIEQKGLKEEMAFVQEWKQKLSSKKHSFKEEIEELTQSKEKKEQELKDRENQIFQMKLDINEFQAEWDKKELEKNHLKDRFFEKYNMSIKDFTPSLEPFSLKELKQEMETYQKQLNRIQAVNFLALEEYEKLSKDNFFLNEQKEDLINSKKEVMKVISHIDRLCKTRFNDMLEEINKRFSRVFPIVFQGDNAKAELILCEDPEGNESGVDILIHPPGKRPQSVSLLSRGEKALTSICLIYSLFLVKPSPFCIIDEADAPLDDANIFRFLSVLKEMSRKSQLIAITHNKYTMQSCKKLYGVTMKEPGISQIVSVDMEKQGENILPPSR